MKYLLDGVESIEKQKIISTYFGDQKTIRQFPSKAKRIAILLEYITAQFFIRNVTYTEKEVNEILKKIYIDYATVRRELIEFRFLERSDYCKEYWVK
ncbi:DUF2087 domain-containing protein [Fredinandcohnia sp. 179-A 10B2 NHS]|uniref:DUF2087 domain-containing protein n=1 Tax=Fredinandcohnia sp. 179-A 10B2 NHS TaxID=3235176 RepID=UPI0039A2CC9F